MSKRKKDPSFEEIVERLEEIAEKLERGEPKLEEALALFEEGVHLAKGGTKRLDDAERRLEILLQDDGLEGFNPGGEDAPAPETDREPAPVDNDDVPF